MSHRPISRASSLYSFPVALAALIRVLVSQNLFGGSFNMAPESIMFYSRKEALMDHLNQTKPGRNISSVCPVTLKQSYMLASGHRCKRISF